MLYRHALRPLLFGLGRDAETIHERILASLALISRSPAATATLRRVVDLATATGGSSGSASCELWGLRFPNPIGLAAGFDKNAIALPALAALGFGFLEAGTITRYPQLGNPRPRLYRIPSEAALINRMGFNNAGAEAVAANLATMWATNPLRAPLGVSLGKSKATPLDEAVQDYLASLDLLYPYGDYFAVNVSSPNTPGLRALQERDRLDALLSALVGMLRERASESGETQPKPLLVKVAPDLDDAGLDELLAVCLARGASGLIAVNTTLERGGLGKLVPAELLAQPGGLSGRPLFARALEVVNYLHERAGEQLPIIGCGGIFTADDAKRMMDAGASLLQVYTSFIYEGPLIARRLAAELTETQGRITKGQDERVDPPG